MKQIRAVRAGWKPWGGFQAAMREDQARIDQAKAEESQTRGCDICGETALYRRGMKGYCKLHREEARHASW